MKKVKDVQEKVYKHLQSHERDEIAVRLAQGYSQKMIAEVLHRHPATIGREINRNGSQVIETIYRSNRAQLRADERKKKSHQKIRLKNELIRDYVIHKLYLDMTPEQIAGRIKFFGWPETICPEAIYQWIYLEEPTLISFLTRANRKRRKRGYSRKHSKSHIPERIPIEFGWSRRFV